MHNFIVRLMAAFIINKDARRVFREKYWHRNVKDRIRTLDAKIERVNNKIDFLTYKLDIINDLLPKEMSKQNINMKPKSIRVNGKNNHIYVDGQEWSIDNDISGLQIDINGDNNIIELSTPYNFAKTYIEIGKKGFPNDNCHIKIGKNPTVGDTWIRLAHGCNQHVFIGDNFRFWGKEIICDENSGITIGNNCRFSNYVIIRCSDGHSVIDDTTKKAINPCNLNMTIGDRCWIGTRVTLTKNAGLANDTIVAAGSVVTKSFTEEKVIVAGNPAKIIKRGVIHSGTSPMKYNYKNI